MLTAGVGGEVSSDDSKFQRRQSLEVLLQVRTQKQMQMLYMYWPLDSLLSIETFSKSPEEMTALPPTRHTAAFQRPACRIYNFLDASEPFVSTPVGFPPI